ncbi:ribonuclease H-like domain-containing protein [Roseofilum capinflatum]|uniref:Ribonuclease D n=1 Tax=Roseofilum capinflatum BLCC-M114 TaxID=3022440 RepID=A0ABT7B8V9_9CYAN|nr:ribonuclease H-like domain-containing protein [Roseofilum capinflatum]MDJ1175606.1 ribonuclease D [Roseofilum capinflatum BLCC-M114]
MTIQPFQIGEQDLNDEQLAHYMQVGEIAVDTETMGLLPLRDRLCLVQIADPQGHVIAIRIAKGQTTAPNLKQLLECPTIIKVFHFARFDVAQFEHHFDITVNPIFCTKVASKLARTYTNRHGLKELVQELEKVELDKSAQSSDWGNVSNLSEEQLSYAANDVRYLISVKEKLIHMLHREERWELAQQCFGCIPVLVALDLLQYKDVLEH